MVATAPAVAKTQFSTTLTKGAFGESVKQLQQRLTELGFAPGPIDGQFGSGTQQALWAFDKLVRKAPRADASSSVTNEQWQTMQDNIVIAPRRADPSPGVTHVEIYVPEQVLVVFTDNVAKLIAHISTGEQNPDGTPKHWCDNVTYNTGKNGEALAEPKESYECADAKTPGGIFKFTRRYEGKRVGPLGGMMNPVYFNYGIAIHGADNVPLQPASHGCVRLNQTIAKVFPALVENGDRVYVWGQDGKEPEQYSKDESLPSFNRRRRPERHDHHLEHHDDHDHDHGGARHGGSRHGCCHDLACHDGQAGDHDDGEAPGHHRPRHHHPARHLHLGPRRHPLTRPPPALARRPPGGLSEASPRLASKASAGLLPPAPWPDRPWRFARIPLG